MARSSHSVLATLVAVAAAVLALLSAGGHFASAQHEASSVMLASEADALLPIFPGTATVDHPSTSTPTPTLREMGPCVCNEHIGICDADCHCDVEDCSAEAIAAFTGTANEGPAPSTTLECVDPDLVKVNKRGDITANVFGNLMCLTKNNSPSKGYYLDTPAALTETQITDIKNTYTAPIAFASTSTSTSTAVTSHYTTGASLPRADVAADGSLSLSSPAFVSLPAADMQGMCADDAPLTFLSQTSARCQRSTRAATAAAACSATGAFAPAQLLSKKAVAAYPGAAVTAPENWVPVLITEVFAEAPATGLLTVSYNISTAVAAGQDLEDVTAYTFPAPVWSATACTCSGALLRVSYSVAYDPVLMTVTRVNATAVTGTITGILTAAGTCALPLTHAYETAASFKPTWGADTARSDESVFLNAATGVVAAHESSGAPGYADGASVLAASSLTITDPVTGDTLGTAMNAAAGGLALMRYERDTLTCLEVAPATPATPAVVEVAKPVAVGVNTRAQCLVPVASAADLETLCSSADGVSKYLTLRHTHVGTWGNSSRLNPLDWTPVQVAAYPASTGTWEAATGTCRSMVTGLLLEFTTADYGSRENPQRAILDVRASYTRADVKLRAGGYVDVPVQTAVAFYHYPWSGVKEVVPSAPPVLPTLPADFLYPFFMPTNGAGAGAGAGVAALLAVVAAALMAVVAV